MLVIAILPASLTFEDSPNIHRSFLMIIPLTIISSGGMYAFLNLFNKKSWVILSSLCIGSMLFVEFIYIQHQYIYQAPSFKSVLRGDGMGEASKWLAENKNNYEKIYSTGYEDFAIYYLFNTKNFDKSLMGTFEKNPILPPVVDNISFSRDLCPLEHDANFELKKGELLIVHGDCPGYEGLVEVKRVVRRDSTIAFKMLVRTK
jgi:hypothetical protein